MKQQKLLMLVHAPQTRPGHLNWVALRDWVRRELPDVTIEMSALGELALVVDGPSTRIYDTRQCFDVADFDAVVFRTLYGHMEVAIATAAYCRKKGVSYIDQYIPRVGNGKLSCAFVRWEHGLPVPRTAYGPASELTAIAQKGDMGWPLVLKADHGKKGNDNHLLPNPEAVKQLLADNPETAYVMQSFIPNNGDYRILTLNGQARLAILRRAAEGQYLNNTSKGGTAETVPLKDVPKEVIDLAVKASKVEKLAVAGADILTDATTGKAYVLEVNRAPQLATGASAETKMHEYGKALRELLGGPKKGAISDD